MANDDEDQSIEISVEIDASTNPARLRDETGEESTLTAKRPVVPEARSPADHEPTTLQPQLVVRDLGSVPVARGPAVSALEEQPAFLDDDEETTAKTRGAKLVENAPGDEEETQTDVHAGARKLAKKIARNAALDEEREAELDDKAAKAANLMSLPKSSRQLVELAPQIAGVADDLESHGRGATMKMVAPSIQARPAGAIPTRNRVAAQSSPLPTLTPRAAEAVALPSARKKSRRGGLVFVLLLACAAGAAAAYHFGPRPIPRSFEPAASTAVPSSPPSSSAAATASASGPGLPSASASASAAPSGSSRKPPRPKR